MGAFVEKFGDLDIFLTRSAVDECQIASDLIIPDVRLADVTDRQVLGRWGLTAKSGPVTTTSDPNCGPRDYGKRASAASGTKQRHDPRADLHSIALFGKPGLQRDRFVAAGSVPISDELIDETTRIFGIEVLPATVLP